MVTRTLVVGDRVRLTGDFLRSTGQIAGGEGQSRWTVVACPCGLCADGRFVAVDQPSDFALVGAVGDDRVVRQRHINARNLEVVKR